MWNISEIVLICGHFVSRWGVRLAMHIIKLGSAYFSAGPVYPYSLSRFFIVAGSVIHVDGALDMVLPPNRRIKPKKEMLLEYKRIIREQWLTYCNPVLE